jgi:WD40 repeat protein
VKTGLPIGNPLKHEGSAQEALFSPKGGALLVTYMNGGWQLWDTRSGESIGDEVKLGTLARAIGFEPNGKSFSLLGQDGSVTRLDADWLDPQTNPQKLILATQLAGWCKVNSQGSLDPVSADQWVKLWNQYRKESK